MKIRFTPILMGSAFLLSLLTGSVAYAALSGNYTIDATGSATATNYLNVSSAVSDLVSGTRTDGGPVNGPGVTGPVVLRIAAGTGPYNEQVTFGAIAGTSASNTVTLTGGPTMEVITYGAAVTSARHVVGLSGASYVILDSLTLLNTSPSFGYGVWMTNNADFNVVRNSRITVDTTSTSANFAGIVISGAASATTTGNNGDDNLVENNIVTGGYYGFTATGTSTSVYSQNNHVINNVFREFYYYGIRHYEQNGGIIRKNTLRERPSGSTSGYGMYIYYNDRFLIEQNDVQAGYYGIYVYYGNYQGGSPTSRATIRNNFIGGNFLNQSTQYGIYITTNARDIDIFHNSTSLSGTNSRGLYILSGTGADVRNNSFSVAGSTTGYAIYISSTNYVNTVDYNNYYAPDASNFIYLGTAYSQSTYQGGGGYNINSRDGNPNYVDVNNNLHAFAAQLFDGGDPTVGVTEDFDGDSRPNAVSTIPDIGADEYLPDSLDVSPLAIVDPTNFTCPDSNQVVRVVIGNRGLNTVTGFVVGVNVSGGATATLSTTYTGSLALGASDTVVVGTFNNWPGGTMAFSAYTALPGDQTTSNDTMMESIEIGMTLPAPTAAGMSVCGGDSAQLTASSSGNNYWYDAPASGNLLASGNTLSTGPLASSTNYYVEARGTAVGSVTTTFANNNSCGGGNMFDITAIGEVTIDSFDLNISSSAQVDIYYKVGTHIGFELNSAAWTLLGSTTVTSAGIGNPSRCVIGGLTIPAGQVYGIYVATTTIVYTTLTGATDYVSPDMIVTCGTGLCGQFSGTNFPRGWNGTVYYRAESCPSQRTLVPVTVTPQPVVNLMDSSYCGSATLDAGSGGTGYLWSNNATTQTTTVTSSGQYSVMVTNGNCSASDTANIVINPLPVVNLGADTTLCDGASMTLNAGNPGSTYLWSNAATTQTISVTAAGTYTAQVTSADGCQGGDDIVVSNLDSPAGTGSANTAGCPTIAFSGNSTGGSPATTVWDFGDGNTGTGFNPGHTYAANGQYTVTYTQTNDCGTSVSTLTVDINCLTGLEESVAGSAVLYPNPTQNQANLQLELTASGSANVVLADLTGKVISSRIVDMAAGSNSITFDMSTLSTGIYIVRFASETFNWQGKLIRE